MSFWAFDKGTKIPVCNFVRFLNGKKISEISKHSLYLALSKACCGISKRVECQFYKLLNSSEPLNSLLREIT